MMWNKDVLRYRECDPSGAPPGWFLRCIARCQGTPAQTFVRRSHEYTSIEYVESGYATLSVNGETLQLGAGDSFILPQGVEHRIVCDTIKPWRILFLDCFGTLPGQLLTAFGLDKTLIYPGVTIAQPLRNLLNFVGDDIDLHIRAGQAIQEIFGILHESRRRPPDWPKIVVKAKSFIDANLESSFRLADVARYVGCSEAHLSRTFRQYVGSPPGDYLIARRMDLAKALLDTTDETMKTISERLGYHDSFSFSHAFKAVVGIAPTKWREVQRS
jgi:AraC family transcriptional regulator, arabinose operon regulatory protein